MAPIVEVDSGALLSFVENRKEKDDGSKLVVENQVVGAISNIAKFLFAAGDTGVKLVKKVSSVKVCVFVGKCLVDLPWSSLPESDIPAHI